MQSDDELLDFDRARLADGDRTDFEALLAEHGDLYRNHLTIARWIDGWRSRMSELPTLNDPDFGRGTDYGLREIAAHLRQGDFLPEGALLAEETW